MAEARRKALEFARSLDGVDAEVYVTAPGAEIDEDHELVQALEAAHEEVFGAAPERDVTRWFSDASVLTRYGIATVNYGTSSGLPDAGAGGEPRDRRPGQDGGGVREGGEGGLPGSGVKLVTFDEGRVGAVDGDEIAVLDVADMRTYFERGGADETGERVPLEGVRPGADRAEEVLPHGRQLPRARGGVEARGLVAQDRAWIVFFQNTDAIVGPDDPVVYPEHLTEELDYELELAVVLRKPEVVWPEDVADYIGGYVIFNDVTARDIQRREMESGVFSYCKAIDTFCRSGRGSSRPTRSRTRTTWPWSCA